MSDELSGNSTDELITKALDNLIKAFTKNDLKTRVGVLGDKNARKENSGPTNADIGAKHEFGLDGMPVRSFLRIPITDNMQAFLEQSKFFTKVEVAQIVKSGSLEAWIAKVGIVGEQIVAEAFNTGGFGKWKPSNFAHKKNHQTLIETQQLRNSVTSEVK